MNRAPKHPPLFRRTEPGRNAYLAGYDFGNVIQGASRAWSVNGEYRSVQQHGGGYVKRIDDFTSHYEDENTFLEFIRECSEQASFMPSSYASVFHDRFKSPRVRWSVNALLAPYFRGAWNEARVTGVSTGHYRAYDINSAYLWASTLGLPQTRSYQFATSIAFTRPGLYVVTLRDNNMWHPYPFNRERVVLATSDEIEQLNLDIASVDSGVTWTDSLPEDAVTSITRDYSFGKQMSRGYWGRWASADKVTCETKSGARWEIGNPILNYVWASVILSRVRLRLWEVSKNAIHFFTDSVITRDELPIGTALGNWRHVADFPNGLDIKHAGFYREPDADTWLKHSGLSLN
jgi:hypothetical protein